MSPMHYCRFSASSELQQEKDFLNSKQKENEVRWPGVEPGSAAWKATMLTVTPPTLRYDGDRIFLIYSDNFESFYFVV